jgi:hypothetical protein
LPVLPGGRSVAGMPENAGVQPARYLLELVRPADGWPDLQALVGRAREAAAGATHAGDRVRLLRSIYVPEDESCFLLYEASSPDAVVGAAGRAGLNAAGLVIPAVRLGEAS